MKKKMILPAGLLLVFLAGFGIAARTDLFEVHNVANTLSVRIDSGARFVQSAAIATANAFGPIAITGNFSATGTGSFGDALTLTGERISTPTSYSVGATTTITPTSELGILLSTGAAVTWAGSPSIATTSATNGQYFELMAGSTQSITFTDSTTLQLSTSGVSNARVFSNIGDNIGLRYYNSVWYEVNFSTGHQ